jgi:site-specific DNA recombinase
MDRGNLMTPTHTNKKGARYRYYVSHGALQNRKDPGGVLRVSAPEIESAAIKAMRRYLKDSKSAQCAAPTDDRALVEQFIHRVVVGPDNIEMPLRRPLRAYAG